MHEASYTQEIVDAILDALKAYPGCSPAQAVVRVGEMLHLVPESVQAHFAQMTRGTVLENVSLVLEEVPVQIKCRNCNFTGGVDDHHALFCSKCGSFQVQLLHGKEITIEPFEIAGPSEKKR